MSVRSGPTSSARVLWGAASGFWLLVTALSAAQMVWIARAPGQWVDLGQTLRWQAAYFVGWIPFTVAVWWGTWGWLPERFGGSARLLLVHLPVATVVSLAHSFVVALFSAPPGNPAATLAGRFLAQLRGQFVGEVLVYTAVAASGAALTLHDRYRERETAASRLQAELVAARLLTLRAHLQPHFLFNSLHSIAALARAGETARVVRLIAALSELLRHVLDASEGRTTLREEIDIVERYLEIQGARFPDRLGVTLDLDPEAAEARVPLLLVQPLVENAVRHGLGPRVRPGSLVVRAVRDDGRLRIDVLDDGVGLPSGFLVHDSPGTGLRNLASRLAAEFGETATLEVAPREEGGVRATVTLPYTTP